ncbi:hypothetical protein NDU88_012026 [Pleurodeles waltl]|uniref:Uncharacterized protein n=1 Tax=Pleurodeles waltl TaxID=8319 RepID=A0AAV7R242_PLEWA|nr:hypothetical protein NDU88_012026 [Pleurodeles waltl]
MNTPAGISTVEYMVYRESDTGPAQIALHTYLASLTIEAADIRFLFCFHLNLPPTKLATYKTMAVLVVQQQRGSFLAVKRCLRELDIHYSLLFPARLWMLVDRTTHFFDSADEAWSWMESTGLVDSCPPPSEAAKPRGTQGADAVDNTNRSVATRKLALQQIWSK